MVLIYIYVCVRVDQSVGPWVGCACVYICVCVLQGKPPVGGQTLAPKFF